MNAYSPPAGDLMPVPVHVVSGIPAAASAELHRTEYLTVVLTADDPVQQLLPQSPNRICAWLQALDNDVVLGKDRNQAGAATNITGSTRTYEADNGTGTLGPTAAQVLTSVTLPPGEYTVQWSVGLGGTTGSTDANNFGLFQGATELARSVSSSTSGTIAQQQPVPIAVGPGGATIAIQAIANGTGTATYRAELVIVSASQNTPYPSGALIPAGNTTPYPLDTNDVVYVGATTEASNSRVAVTATYRVAD